MDDNDVEVDGEALSAEGSDEEEEEEESDEEVLEQKVLPERETRGRR